MSQGPHHNYMISAVALDFGHTIIDERVDILLEDTYHEQHLMPGVREALTGLAHPVAIWANTRRANAEDVWRWLQRTGLAAHVTWVVTSVDAGARKPAREFFDYALRMMAMGAEDVLFVGNQRNTDIAGGRAYGIRTVWISDDAYHSADDCEVGVEPTFTIVTLAGLPGLVAKLGAGLVSRT